MAWISRTPNRIAATAVAVVAVCSFGIGQSSGPAEAATIAEIANQKGADRHKILVEGARKEGKVVLYSAMIVNQALRPMAAAFGKKYPFLKVEYWRGNSRAIIGKVLAETRANAMVADVIEGGGLSQALMKAGAIQSYSTPSLKAQNHKYYDSKGYWAATRFSYFGLGYNTKLVKASDVPKTYQDLLDPKWKGKMVWAGKTETGSAMMFITFVRASMGEEKAEAYLKKLSRQNIIGLSGSPRAVINRVMQGEYPMALNIFMHHPIISALKGASMASQPLEPVPSNASVITLAKAAPHPHAAMLLIDFALSKEGQNVLRNANYLPSHPEVAPRSTLNKIVPRVANLKETFLSPETLYRYRSKSLELQSKYFKRP